MSFADPAHNHSALSGRGKSRRTGPPLPLAALATAVVALAVAVVPLVLLRPRASQAPTSPKLDAVALKVVAVPRVAEAVLQGVDGELAGFLKSVYEEAFITGPPSPAPAPSALPSSAARIAGRFTRSARGALEAHPEVFDPAGTYVTSGRLTFEGVVTFDKNTPRTALLHVDLEASGTMRGAVVRVAQAGNLVLNRSTAGWRIAGFDLKLTEVNATPSPSPNGAS